MLQQTITGLHQIPKTEISHHVRQLRDIRGGTIAPNSLALAMTGKTQRDSISLQSPNAFFCTSGAAVRAGGAQVSLCQF